MKPKLTLVTDDAPLEVWNGEELSNRNLAAHLDARTALDRAATAYRVISLLPRYARVEAMRACVTRPYVFERNSGRWPDGMYHLLDRKWMPWLGHDITRTLDELEAIGLCAWQASPAVRVAFADSCLPLVDDVLQERPRPQYLLRLVNILYTLARDEFARADALREACDAR